MPMDPARLPSRAQPAPTPQGEERPAPTAPAPASTPVAVPDPAPPAGTGEPFTGLDPLTRSLIEAAPLVAAAPTAPTAPPPTSPPTQPDHQSPRGRRISLKQPALLVALGGTLAAGLLVLTGATKHRRTVTGHPAPAGHGTRAAPATPAPILPANMPAPAGTWMVAGGAH
ncbi:hypothetical protein GCM10008019_40910 [Deinococcus soli (ex Cha et al. 2016)]|nr:hypothetical protein GCM10008019_40910 [Deinococcus soli (ex Cha et al. 2016)]